MQALRGVILGLCLATLAACAGAYVAGDVGAHHQKLRLDAQAAR